MLANTAISLGCIICTISLNLIGLRLTATSTLDIEISSLLYVHTDLFMVAMSIMLAGYVILPKRDRGRLFPPLVVWIILILIFFGVLAVKGQAWASFANTSWASLIIPNIFGLIMVGWAVAAAKGE